MPKKRGESYNNKIRNEVRDFRASIKYTLKLSWDFLELSATIPPLSPGDRETWKKIMVRGLEECFEDVRVKERVVSSKNEKRTETTKLEVRKGKQVYELLLFFPITHPSRRDFRTPRIKILNPDIEALHTLGSWLSSCPITFQGLPYVISRLEPNFSFIFKNSDDADLFFAFLDETIKVRWAGSYKRRRYKHSVSLINSKGRTINIYKRERGRRGRKRRYLRLDIRMGRALLRRRGINTIQDLIEADPQEFIARNIVFEDSSFSSSFFRRLKGREFKDRLLDKGELIREEEEPRERKQERGEGGEKDEPGKEKEEREEREEEGIARLRGEQQVGIGSSGEFRKRLRGNPTVFL